MNPAILNYLQNQQVGQPQPTSRLDSGMMNMPPKTENHSISSNPFDIGIKRAIESARESLGMTDKQQEKLLRRSILNFAGNIAQAPKQRGFFNNFGSIARNMAPAILDYDEGEEEAINQNNALANQILAYQKAEEAKQANAEQQNWQRTHAENQLAEQKRYHDMTLQAKQAKQAKHSGNIESINTSFGEDLIPIETKDERKKYVNTRNVSSTFLHKLENIKKQYEDLKEETKDDVISPFTPYGVGTVANTAKDFFGYFGNSKEAKKLQEQTVKRKLLDGQLKNIVFELDKDLKGGNALTESIIKRFENADIFPTLKQGSPVFESKLNDMINGLKDEYKSSSASLKYGVHLTPYDLQKIENSHTESARNDQPIASDQFITMVSPEGEEWDVPQDQVDIFLKQNYRRVQ